VNNRRHRLPAIRANEMASDGPLPRGCRKIVIPLCPETTSVPTPRLTSINWNLICWQTLRGHSSSAFVMTFWPRRLVVANCQLSWSANKAIHLCHCRDSRSAPSPFYWLIENALVFTWPTSADHISIAD